MKRPAALFTVLALLSCTGSDGVHAPEPLPPTAPSDPVLHAAVIRDLSLHLALTGPAAVDANGTWPLAVTLENKGSTPHSIVRASDGSGAGWREPHVFYTAEIQLPSGAYVAAHDEPVMRCGNYASAWKRDVVELAAHGSIAIEDYTPPSYSFDFERSARVRITAHYAWDGGTKRSFDWNGTTEGAPEPLLPHELRAVGPYELVSNPVELDMWVDRPIDIALSVHDTHVGRGHRAVQGFVEAVVTSASSHEEDLGSDELDSRFWLEGRDQEDHSRIMIGLGGPQKIAPGQRFALTVKDTHDLDFDAAGPWRLRVRYEALRTRADGTTTVRRSRSAWVAIEVR